LILTPAGEACLPYVRSGFASLRAALDAVQRPQHTSLLSVSTPPGFAMRLLVPLTHNFQSACPGIDLQINIRLRDPAPNAAKPLRESNVFQQLAEENDIVIGLGKYGFGDLCVEQLKPLSIELVCSPELARTGGLKSIEDVARFQWLHDDRGLKYGGASFWSQWLARTRLGLKDQGGGEHYMHPSLAIEAAVRGKGLLITTSRLCQEELARGELISPFNLRIVTGVSYFLLSRRTYQPTAALFKHWLQAAI
jgi:LysR family transcriptional regulator, glycine cleavage system transcriptional activator